MLEVTTINVFYAFGRLGWGTASDRIGRRPAYILFLGTGVSLSFCHHLHISAF